MLPANRLAWRAWNTSNEFDRPVAGMGGLAPLPTQVMRDAIKAAGGCDDDYDKIMLIERIMYKAWREKQKAESKTKKR